MSGPQIFFSEVNERQGVFTRRAFLMGGVTGAALGALTGRLTQLQLIQNAQYRKAAADNQYNARVIIPPRGVILDRNGVVLASNRGNFRVMIARDQVNDLDTTLDELAQLVPLTDVKRRQIRRELVNSPRFTPVSVAEDLTWEQFAAVNARAPELPGVTAEMGEVRVYPYAGSFAHVIGYVAKINANDLKAAGPQPDRLLLHPGFRMGKQGVERSLDLDLRGVPGEQKVEVDAKGRVVRMYPKGDISAVPGKEVVLTLDADIQNRALEVFGQESGAAVMMDCRTGDILCLASAPSFDANSFVRGLTGEEYRALSQYDHKPLFNKALTATYPPGSTFKTIVAMAALEAGVDPKRTYVCNGTWFFGRTWKCDAHHGVQDMKSAIATSCDIFFYQTALGIGPDRIHTVARKFGLGDIFDIGIPGQKPGLVPNTEYKRRTFKKDPVWHPGETPSMGIGQGYTNLNPLQLCVMTARIANGQKSLHPRLIRSIGGKEQPSGGAVPDLDVDKGHLHFVREAMAAVTTVGTAARFGDLGLGDIRMAGKTGTAQAYSYGGGRGAHGAVGEWRLRDHAWFVAFAPQDAPRYALSVLVEHGGFGAQAAAPRARELMRMALLKDPEIRARIEHPAPLPPLPENVPDSGSVVPDLPPTPIDPSAQPGPAPPPAPQAALFRGRRG
jgi:penicillin-binding protein 2